MWKIQTQYAHFLYTKIFKIFHILIFTLFKCYISPKKCVSTLILDYFRKGVKYVFVVIAIIIRYLVRFILLSIFSIFKFNVSSFLYFTIQLSFQIYFPSKLVQSSITITHRLNQLKWKMKLIIKQPKNFEHKKSNASDSKWERKMKSSTL